MLASEGLEKDEASCLVIVLSVDVREAVVSLLEGVGEEFDADIAVYKL